MVSLQNPFKFGTDPWDPSRRFETSWLLPPYALCACRAIFGLYGVVAELFAIGWHCTHPSTGGCARAGDNFSYFTILTFYGLALYNLTAALHTFTYARTGTPLLDRFPRPLQALHAFFYSTIVTYPFIVTAVYWGVIYPGIWFPDSFTRWSNTSQHALNSVFAFFEIVAPNTAPPLWIHAWWLVFVLGLYLSLVYLTYLTKGFYTYSFLDIQVQGSATVAAWIAAIGAATVFMFCLARCLIWLRQYLTESKG